MNQASVLVVEDNDLERQITADTLRDEGFAVEAAALGKRAMEMLQLSRFDVVLTDLMMPGMSGEEILAKVKPAIPCHPGRRTDGAWHDRERRPGDEKRRLLLSHQADRPRGVGDDGRKGRPKLANLQEENQLLRTQMEGELQVEGIIGQDPAIQEIIKIMRKSRPRTRRS